jgi:hypothetical protein
MCIWTIFSTTFSNGLPVVDNRLSGHKFGGNLESLPGFGKVINFASFTPLLHVLITFELVVCWLAMMWVDLEE